MDAIKACGLDCVQLSLDCAGLPAMPDRIAPEAADRIRREAAARGIKIASVQGTFNMSHPDAEHRRAGLRRLGVLAAACRQLGTSKIHLCTGTRDRENMWRRHPDNDSPEAWRDMAACVREAADIAERAGVVLAFEPEVNNVVDSAKKARRLLDEIGSPHLKVTMDAANLFHAGELAHMDRDAGRGVRAGGKDIVHGARQGPQPRRRRRPRGGGAREAGLRPLSFPVARLRVSRGRCCLHGLSEAQVPGCVAFSA